MILTSGHTDGKSVFKTNRTHTLPQVLLTQGFQYNLRWNRQDYLCVTFNLKRMGILLTKHLLNISKSFLNDMDKQDRYWLKSHFGKIVEVFGNILTLLWQLQLLWL